MTFINVTPSKEIKHLSLMFNSLLLERVNNPHVLELCMSKYLIKSLIVENMQVVHKLEWPDKYSTDIMWDPIKLP